MSCPHATFGDPNTCSQCLGAAARVVRVDGATNRLVVGGELQARGMIPLSKQSNYAKRAGAAVQARATRGRPRNRRAAASGYVARDPDDGCDDD